MTQADVERLIYHMPTVAAHATNTWATDFARSIVRQSRRRGWRPSPKQLCVMRELVSDLFTHDPEIGGDFDVIE